MSSQLAWLDHDDAQRRRMVAVMELFKEEGTVDELGVGSIRDAIADILFPGGSVLHTRARYLFFVPWLAELASAGRAPDAAVREFRRLEVRLIHALLAGGETSGVIGAQAKEKLKRMPSAAYWAALHRYGIRRWDTTIEGFFRRSATQGRLRQSEATADDPGSSRDGEGTALHPDLCDMPEGTLESTTFDMTPGEADFLRERILTSCRGSLLAWLVGTDSTDATEVWMHPRLADFPTDLREVLDHGRRFAVAVHGAPIVYNLILAERLDSVELVERYREMFAGWQEELSEERPFDNWDRPALWSALRDRNRPIAAPTRLFAEAWLRLVESGVTADSAEARRVVQDREVAIKGGRARVVNAGALDTWRGDSGLVRLDYRWGVASRILRDITGPLPEGRS